MKIGLFSHVCHPFTNGVSVSVEQLANELKMHNHDVTIISNNYDQFRNDYSEAGNIKVISFPIFYQNLRVPFFINPSLYKELAKHNFDIVHSHSDFGQAVIARTYARLHNTPIIHTYHCNYLEYARQNFGKYSPYILHKPVKYYTRLICETADRVIAPSIATKDLLERDFKVKKEIDLIPNGINLSKFSAPTYNQNLRERYGITKDDFVILSLSRLSKEKNIANILFLMPLLADCPNLKLLIVGGGPEEKELKRIARVLNLNNVIFTGEIPFEKVQNYYKLGNIFITASKAETQGLSVLEALSSSLPALCPDIPLYQEMISEGENGFLYNSDGEIIKLIKLCYKHPHILKDMGEKAKQSTIQFSLSHSVNKIEQVYEEELTKKHK